MLLTLIVSMLGISKAAAEKRPYVQYDGNVTLTFHYDEGFYNYENGNTYLISGSATPWLTDQAKMNVEKVVFDESFRDYRPTSTAGWFKNLIRLSSTVGMRDNLYTSEVTDMSYMFYGTAIRNLDLTTFPNFVTSKVENMSRMFEDCRFLYSINLSSFDTRNVTDMECMFGMNPGYGTYLTTVDISSFNTAKVTDMSMMFSGCTELERIFVGKEWTTDAVTSSFYMFRNCEKIIGGAGTTFDPNFTDATYARIDGGPTSPGYLSESGPYAVIKDGVMTFRYDNERYNLDGAIFSLNEGDHYPNWRTMSYDDLRHAVTTVVFDQSFAKARPTTTCKWFDDFMNLEAIYGMKEYLNTSEVTNMREMFRDCEKLDAIDLSNFNTEKVTDMSVMFFDCNALTTLDLRSFSTWKVTNMEDMFLDCDNLTTIYVGYLWNTEKVTESNNMFLFCPKLVGGMGTPYDVNYVDVSYAHNDFGESDPGYLTQIFPYTMLDGETLTYCYDNLFYTRPGNPLVLDPLVMALASLGNYFDEVTTAVFDPSFAEYRPVQTAGWFYKMPKLETIIGMKEYLNTSEVIAMNAMFYQSSHLKSIDLSNFDTHKVKNMSDMFNGCTYLTTILVGGGWSTANVTESTDMFLDCFNLEGGAGTRYDPNHTDGAYARIDGGTSKPGYLCDKIPYAVFNSGTLTFYADREFDNRQGTVYVVPSWGKPEWVTDETCYDVTTVVFDPSFANYVPTTTEYWFNNMENLTEIKGMNNYLNTTHVKYMSFMFDGCRSMQVLDLSSFWTHNVTMMANMFANCTSLTTILVSKDWSTSSVTSSKGMFTNCRKLVGMAGTPYDKNHTDKEYAHADGGETNPGYLTMKMMYAAVEGQTMKFYYDGDFYKRTVPVYETDKLQLASTNDHAFDNVVTAEFDPSFADARPTSTGGWFFSMPKLSTFKGMKEYLNTSEVITMKNMFNYLLYVEKLDLSGFDTHNVQDMSGMFGNNYYLETIWVGDGWNTSKVIESSYMFNSCIRLVGGAGTTYDEGHIDVAYAHIDGGPSNPGYLTEAKGIKGDVNGDGKVNSADVQKIYALMAQGATGATNPEADVNDDGFVNSADIQKVYAIMASL